MFVAAAFISPMVTAISVQIWRIEAMANAAIDGVSQYPLFHISS
jgi:hypothetical protein